MSIVLYCYMLFLLSSFTSKADSASNSEPRLNVSGNNVSDKAIKVYWNSVLLDVHDYAVKYWAIVEGEGTAVERNVSNTTNSLLINDLKPYTVYVVQVTALGQAIKGRANISTDEGVPGAAPTNITAYNKSSTSILVHWRPVPEISTNGVLLGYTVDVFFLGSSRRERSFMTCNDTVEIHGLEKYSTYLVTVAGHTKKGPGVNDTVLFRTDEDVPSSPPVNVSVRTTNQSDLEIAWSRVPVNHTHSVLMGYQLRLLEEDGKETLISHCASVGKVKLFSLTLYHTYCVNVSAFSRKGNGPESSTKCVMVDDGASCEPPKQLTVGDVTDTSAYIKWVYDGVCLTVGFVTGYRLSHKADGENRVSLRVMDARATSMLLEKLTPNTTYSVEVQVLTNNSKDSLVSQPVSLTTKERAPPQPSPSNVRIVRVLSDSILLSWSFTYTRPGNMFFGGFKILYTPTGGTTNVVNVQGNNKRLYSLSGLKPNTFYQVVIRAFNDQYDGPASLPVNVTTLDGVPSAPPSNVTSISKTSTNQLFIQWVKIPDDDVNGVLTGYVISYKAAEIGGRKVADEVVRKRTVGLDTFSLMLDGLQSFTTYEIKVAGLTRRGEGAFSKPMYKETCRCEERLTTNYMSYPPYVINSASTNMSGIFMSFLNKMVLECCQGCSNGHGKSFVDYKFDGKHNLSEKSSKQDMMEAIDDLMDLSFPVHAHSDQRTYLRTYKYVPVVESPGAVFIVRYGSLDGPVANAVIKSWPLAVIAATFLLLSAILYWILDCEQNPDELPRTFRGGLWEGIWWAVMTASTVGYGDITPRSCLAKCLAMALMIIGCVVFSLLTSCLTTGLTVLSLDDSDLGGMKVAALYDSPEYKLAVKRNAKVNRDRNYTRLEDIREDLLSGEVNGALIDSYELATKRDLFKNESVGIREVIDYRSSFGIVLGGNSVRLQHCFLDYLKNDISLLTSLASNYSDTLEHRETSRAEQVATGMFDSSDSSYITNTVALSAVLTAAVLCGSIYTVWKCRRRKKRGNKEIRRKELILEMKQLVEEFYNNICEKYKRLTLKHKKERQLLLKMQKKEGKLCLFKVKKQRKQINELIELETRRKTHNKLFLDNIAVKGVGQ